MAKKGLTKEQVEHIAKLALLPLTVKKTSILQEQLSEVVGYVGKIQEVHKQSLPLRGSTQEIVHRNTEERVGREDMARADECLAQEDTLSGTENRHNGLFVVPAVFEES